MTKPCVLVVEDDEVMRDTCARVFDRAGYPVATASRGSEALDWLAAADRDCVVLTDIRMPEMDGMELLAVIHERWPDTEVLMMTGFGTIESAVQAMRQGAADYVTKPFKKAEILLAVERVAEKRALRAAAPTAASEPFGGFVATDPVMDDVLAAMHAAARSTANLLLTGESGTGKDMVARTVHEASARASEPFVPVNCASLPGDLIEAELFGNARGAYTGADRARPGLFRHADSGTLFLDEITEMPTGTQAKLLRALQEKRVRPVGAADEVEVDVRLVVATNQDLDEARRASSIRQDLYYRVSVLHIHLPPLRSRPADIEPLFLRFLRRAADTAGLDDLPALDASALSTLGSYPWPGNVRELENLAQRCAASGPPVGLDAATLSRLLAGPVGLPPDPVDRDDAPGALRGAGSLAAAERAAIEQALIEADYNKAEAARILGIARKTLYEKIRRYGLSR